MPDAALPRTDEREGCRQLPAWPDYEVSDRGRVRRSRGGQGARPGRILTPEPSGRFLIVRLRKSGRADARRCVHDLVAEVFLGPCPEGMDANHRNADPGDNRACNLEFVATDDGARRTAGLAGKARGERINTAKLEEEQVREIRRIYSGGGVSQKELGRRYGVSQAEIGYIVARQVWTHI